MNSTPSPRPANFNDMTSLLNARLTERQSRVLALLAEGLLNQQIA